MLKNIFSPMQMEDWVIQAQKELKGKDFQKTLVWDSNEGIEWQPLYDFKNLSSLPIDEIQLSQKKSHLGWKMGEKIEYTNEYDTNELALNAFKNGIDCIYMNFPKDIPVENIQMGLLFKNIKLSDFPIYISCFDASTFLKKLKNQFPYFLKGGIFDSSNILSEYVVKETAAFNNFKIKLISSEYSHLEGANAIQEIGILLADFVQFIEENKSLISTQKISEKVLFEVAISTNFFLEISKMRALRFLLKKVATSYFKEEFTPTIKAKNSLFIHSNHSPFTNILRTTTEAMSACIGGCDILEIEPFDSISEESHPNFSKRIARNISNLLKEESYFSKINEAGAGSYFIEDLTYQIIQKSWNFFLEIENHGGLKQANKSGFIAEILATSLQKKLEDYKNGKVVVGVNKFKNENDDLQPNTTMTFETIDSYLST